MTKPILCRAGIRLREQVDDAFPDRDRTSDGWIGDARHAARTSDHNPDAQGMVRAIDIDADLRSHASEAFDFADQLRLLARSDKRISYVIFNGKIADWKMNWTWRDYKGINPHKKHIHISFTFLGDKDDGMFRIPILTGEPIHAGNQSNSGILGSIISGSRNSNILSGGLGSQVHCQCCSLRKPSSNSSLPQP